ncbi:MAG: signal peptidase I, partial [Actinomycetes bacterium]
KPTILEGDRIFINKVAYDLKFPFTTFRIAQWDDPKWGDVVVLRSPDDGKRLVKRVVGLPGDVMEGRDGYLWRNDVRVDEPYLRPNTFTSEFKKVRVKPDHFWVMGDNREDSADSRVFGQVERSALVGRAVLTVWPPPHTGGL